MTLTDVPVGKMKSKNIARYFGGGREGGRGTCDAVNPEQFPSSF